MPLYIASAFYEGGNGSENHQTIGVFSTREAAEAAKDACFARMLKETGYDQISEEAFAIFPVSYSLQQVELDVPQDVGMRGFAEYAAEASFGLVPLLVEDDPNGCAGCGGPMDASDTCPVCYDPTVEV